ncbi:hypothetical protein KBC99_01910 [Candidatus Saccharibacteria bacterium]|nr:hypothetical protein [Candidatus Saccharibacteria bacterium]
MRKLRNFTLLVISLVIALTSFASAQPQTTPNGLYSLGCQVGAGGPITEPMAERFRAYWPLYEQTAAITNVDPIVLAPVHYREHFGLDNPNGFQGIFQLYSLWKAGKVSFPDTNGQPVSAGEFVEQARLATSVLEAKTHSSLKDNPDESAVARAYFGYNGASKLYARNARPGQPDWDGSPYVMNEPGVRVLSGWSHEPRNPRRHLRPDARPGALIIFRELKQQCYTQFLMHAVAAQPKTDQPDRPASAQAAGIQYLSYPHQPKGSDMKHFTPSFHNLTFSTTHLIILALATGLILAGATVFRPKAKRGSLKLSLLFVFAGSGLALGLDYLSDGWSLGFLTDNVGRLLSTCWRWSRFDNRASFINGGLVATLVLLLLQLTILSFQGGRAAIKSGMAWLGTCFRLAGHGLTWLRSQKSTWTVLLSSLTIMTLGSMVHAGAFGLSLIVVVLAVVLVPQLDRFSAVGVSLSNRSGTTKKSSSKPTRQTRSSTDPQG